jgi:hypothetical protein
MLKRKLKGVFAMVVCVGARSAIIAALYLAGFLAALQLAVLLPEPWSAVGIAALLVVTALSFLGKWPWTRIPPGVGWAWVPTRRAGESSGSRASLAEGHSSAIPASLGSDPGLSLSRAVRESFL